MYCSNCGAEAGGNFCSACGAKLALPNATVPVARPIARPDWRHEVRYEVLIAHPTVRDRIARSAAGAKKGMTGEQWLELYDKLASPPVSLKKLAEIVQPLYARLGIRTGKARTGWVPTPPGEVLAALLCSLAANGRTIGAVHQGEDGCAVEAELPSDLFALAGELLVTVRRSGDGTRVEAATKIPGQLFDWGKSTRCLDRLFGDLGARAA